MFNILRFVVIVVTALIVFGWSVAAGQSPAHQQPVSKVTNSSEISWNDVKGVTLEELPEMPETTANLRNHTKRRVSKWPKWSGPDFGPIRSLEWKPLADSNTPAPPLPPFARSTGWTSEHVGLASATQPGTAASTPVLSNVVRAPAPAARLAFRTTAPAESGALTDMKTVSIRPRRSAAVNVKLLSQLVEAHNLSIAAIEQQLRSRRHWDLPDIESIALQIEELIDGRELWAMYWKLLDAPQRRRVGSVATLSPSLEKLRQRIFETQVAADVNPESVSHLGSKDAKSKLAAIDRQVSQWLRKPR